jgi:hypothetical protein
VYLFDIGSRKGAGSERVNAENNERDIHGLLLLLLRLRLRKRKKKKRRRMTKSRKM